jgi:hypothetical protein
VLWILVMRQSAMQYKFPSMGIPFKRGLNRSIDTSERRPPVPSSPLTREAARHQMTLLVASLATVLFFSGLTAAQISVPSCSLSWEWVCYYCHLDVHSSSLALT